MSADPKQQRRERQHAAIRSEIKAMARSHMARHGAAALSLRAVAGDLGLSSAAIYYYYPNRDALITALIVDAFEAIGAAISEAVSGAGAPLRARMRAGMLAYRAWAIGHPAEYALIFGTPIPGYQAPAEITAPAARQALGSLGQLIGEAHAAGLLRADHAPPPPPIADRAEQWAAQIGQPIALPVTIAMLRAWSVGHGLVSLELDHQLQPIIGDAGALYAYEVERLLDTLLAAP